MTTATAVPTPDWLRRREGTLKQATSPAVFLVFLAGTSQYRLVVTPVGGKFGCVVTQTNNGRRLDKGAAFATADEAVRGGLKDLQDALGWE